MVATLLWLPSALAGPRYATGALEWSDVAAMGLQFWILWFAFWGRVGIALLLALPFAATWPLEQWIRLTYGTPISANFVAIAVESNLAELTNFCSAMGWWWLLPVCWLAAYGLAIFGAFRFHLRWQGRTRWLSFALVGAVAAGFSIAGGDEGWMTEGPSSEALGPDARRGLSVQWADVYPVNQIVAAQTYVRERDAMGTVRQRLAGYSFGARIASTASAADIVVLVIGESSTAERWSLLGYARDTTPRLARLGVAAFRNVASVSTATRTAVPGAIARRPILSAGGTIDPAAEPSLVKAFSEAGYDTYWLSNQASMGPHDSSIAIYAHEARTTRFMNPGTYSSRGSLDGVLLPILEKTLAVPERKLIVLHTLGSHFDQALRYPPEYARFQPSTTSVGTASVQPSGSSVAQRQANDYDNSVFYTDHLLSEIIRLVEAQGQRSVVAYFSDHGSDPPLPQCQTWSAISRTTRASYHVPVAFWMSDALKQANPQAWTALKENEGHPYTTRAVFGSVLQLSGIELRKSSSTQTESFLNPPFPDTPARQTSDGKMYELLANTSCGQGAMTD